MARTRSRLLFQVILLCLISPVSSGAQDSREFANQVWTQLQGVYADIAQEKKLDLHNYTISRMDGGGRDRWRFELSANQEYVVTAACDRDCSDTDLYIKSPGGKIVAMDEGEDDRPTVLFIPEQSGHYTIEIKMQRCGEDPCYVGFGIFGPR
jgi:hypothetical protein